MPLRLPARHRFPHGKQGPPVLTKRCGSRGERGHLPLPLLRDHSRLCVRPERCPWSTKREGGGHVERFPRGQTQRDIPGPPILAEGECGWGGSRVLLLSGAGTWGTGPRLCRLPNLDPVPPACTPGYSLSPSAPCPPLLLSGVLILKKAVYPPATLLVHTHRRLRPGARIRWDRLRIQTHTHTAVSTSEAIPRLRLPTAKTLAQSRRQ